MACSGWCIRRGQCTPPVSRLSLLATRSTASRPRTVRPPLYIVLCAGAGSGSDSLGSACVAHALACAPPPRWQHDFGGNGHGQRPCLFDAAKLLRGADRRRRANVLCTRFAPCLRGDGGKGVLDKACTVHLRRVPAGAFRWASEAFFIAYTLQPLLASAPQNGGNIGRKRQPRRKGQPAGRLSVFIFAPLPPSGSGPPSWRESCARGACYLRRAGQSRRERR